MNQKVEINIDVFCEQLPQVELFVKCFTYYRCMGAIPIEQSEFWDEACTAFLGRTIIAWYNVFVYHKSHVHWSKTVRDMPKEIKENFKYRISKSNDLKEEEYKDYQKNIKSIRDKYFTHTDINWMAHIPLELNLDTTLTIAKEYEGWIHDLHKRECTDYHGPSFDQTIETAKRKIKVVATALKDI